MNDQLDIYEQHKRLPYEKPDHVDIEAIAVSFIHGTTLIAMIFTLLYFINL